MTNDPRLPRDPFTAADHAVYNSFQVLDHFIGRPLTVKLLGGLRYKAFKRAAAKLEAAGEGRLIDIEYRTDLGLKEFNEHYVRRDIPVVFKGAALKWGSVKRWDFDFFSTHYGSDAVPLFDGDNPEAGIEYTPLSEVINRIKAGDKKAYFRFYNVLWRHPELRADFDHEWLQQHSHRNRYFESFQAFIGGAGSVTHIHNAHIANLFVQVHGVKEWVLYPNYYVPFIDPPSTLNGIYRNAPIRHGSFPFSPFSPNYEGYPYWKYLNGYRVRLEPGDVLYNPPFVWHTVRNESHSIGIGYRWINAWHSLRCSPTYYLLDVMAYRPNYFKSLAMVRRDANDQFVHRLKMLEKHR